MAVRFLIVEELKGVNVSLSQVMGNRFSQNARIRKTQDYQRLFKRGKRLTAKGITVLFHINSLEYARLGMIIAKKQIANAVTRNRYKRWIRENFRLYNALNKKSVDLIVIVYKPVLKMEKKEFILQLKRLWQKIAAEN